MLRLWAGALRRSFALNRKDVEMSVSSVVLDKGKLEQGKHALHSTFEELKIDDMGQVEVIAGTMYLLKIAIRKLPDVRSGSELVDFIMKVDQEKEEAKNQKKRTDEED